MFRASYCSLSRCCCPTASLVPLGGLWLWQQGYVLVWASATCLVVAAAYLLQRRLIGSAAVPGLDATQPEEAATLQATQAGRYASRRPGMMS